MSIINEDSKFFESPNEGIIDAIGQPLRRTISIRCCYVSVLAGNVGCLSCIGRKYSLRNGCPVCGKEISATGLGGVAATCDGCGAVILTCGLMDVRAVTLPPEFNDVMIDEGDSI